MVPEKEMIFLILTMSIIIAFYIALINERKITSENSNPVDHQIKRASSGKWIKLEAVNNSSGIF